MKSRRSLQTILFTDIVGSTERAIALGDRGWGEVLEEHHARVHREIRRFGGREIKTMGDGFLAAFDRPAPGIRCAWSIREMANQLGLEVRSGIHTGEVERRGKDLEGVAVHIGSRIADQAEPGEILVSNAVREMETGAGFRFEDRGKRSLKGVPDEWRLFALEGLPAGPGFRTGRWIPELTAHHVKIAGMVIVGLIIVAGIVAALRTLRSGVEPRLAMAEGAAPGIAVLPFDVSGGDLEEWREGMVTLLSTGLDGAGNLRAIDSRTVLAQWNQRIPDGSRADRDMALQIARATGARYALLGSAVSIGENLRLLAEVYQVEDGAHLGSAQVEGAADSVFALVDGLVRETLGVILEEGKGEIPLVNLAALTTGSLPALKVFLEGEAFYRRGALRSAAEAYQRAVEADSTFALAWHRLSTVYGWLEGGSVRGQELRRRAMRYVDRLPERERILANARYLLSSGRVEGVDSIREATQQYPDDAETWFLLGEFYLHFPNTLATLDDAELAFLKAVELDPTFAPYRFHPTELAFGTPPDSALAADRVRELSELNPDAPLARLGRQALALAFGDSARRATVLDSLLSVDEEMTGYPHAHLSHPRFWDVQSKIIDLLFEYPITQFSGELFKRGRPADAILHIDQVEGPAWYPACAVGGAYAMGIPFPVELLEAELALSADDSIASPRTACSAVYEFDRGRRSHFDRVVMLHEKSAERALAAGDSTTARTDRAIATALVGYTHWKNGDRRTATGLLEEADRLFLADNCWGSGPSWCGGSPDFLRYWIGQINLELDRFDKAVRYFRSIRFNPYANYHLGVSYERAGQYSKALESYESFVEYWRDADPELQPLVQQARQAVIRLRGVRRD